MDVTDLGILATNFNDAVSPPSRAAGDLNLDGTVDVGDLGLLATYFNQGADATAGLTFAQALAAHPQLAAAVPEPAASAWLAAGGLLAGRRWRRGRVTG